MIEYNKESKEIRIGSWVSWEYHVKPKYDEISEEVKNDVRDGEYPVEQLPPNADDLTEDQIHQIMEHVAGELEFRDEYDDGIGDIDQLVEDSVREWLEYYVQDQI